MIYPKEAMVIRFLYARGASSRAIGKALHRDYRSVNASLRRDGIMPPVPATPCPRQWRRHVDPAARLALEAYIAEVQRSFTSLTLHVEAEAVEITETGYSFPSFECYHAAINQAHPTHLTDFCSLARDVNVSLDIVLLAYTEALEPLTSDEALSWNNAEL